MATQDRETDLRRRNAEACPVVEAVDRVGTQWRLVVLYDLQDGEKRFNEIQRSTGARSRTLSETLDALTEAGLVERRVEVDSPIASYYALTEAGESLAPVFDAIGDWAETNIDPESAVLEPAD